MASELDCGHEAGVASRRMRRRGFTVWAAVLGMLLGGCGGGSGPASSSGGVVIPPPPAPPPTGSDRGSLIVTVTDPIGDVGAGVRVTVYSMDGAGNYKAVTDGSGRATLAVPAGRVGINAHAPEFAGSIPEMTVQAGEEHRVEIHTRTATPQPIGGIGRVWIAEDGISTDGRQLEFALEIIEVPRLVVPGWDDLVRDVRIDACTPDPANDSSRHPADCIVGPASLDAAYAGVGSDAATGFELIEPAAVPESYVGTTPFASVLLLDQGAEFTAADPADRRLFAAKNFLNGAREEYPVGLAAFSSDHAPSGRYSVLPQQPVTLFPLENPDLTLAGRGFFQTVDSLATLEGGGSALLPAIDRVLDFYASRQSDAIQAMFLLTDGNDDTCGSAAECRALRDAVIARSRSSRVPLVTVGLAGVSGAADVETLGLLAQATAGGAAFWVDDPLQLTQTLAISRTYLAGTRRTIKATFRVESPVAGAFTSGHIVKGRVRYEVCPWDCEYVGVPFVLRIP